MAVDPYGRTTRRDGVTLNYRTLEMFAVAEIRMGLGVRLELSQGSYTSATPQSGGTHDGGGALDVRARDLSGSQRESVVYWLRRLGFAAWLRNPSQGDWPYHIHAIAIGDREMSSAAAQQVAWYKQGLNGLWPPSQGPDDGPRAPWVQYPQEVDLSFYGPERWDAKDFTRLAVELFSEDGIVDPPDSLTTAANPRWAVTSALRKLLFQAIDAIDKAEDAEAAAKAAEAAANAAVAKVEALAPVVGRIATAVGVTP